MEHAISEKLELEDFIAAIDNLAEYKSEILFKNEMPKLAAIVMSSIVNHSDKEVRIYDNGLIGDIADKHDSFLDSVRKAVLLNKSVKIVLKDSKQNDSKTYLTLTEIASEEPKRLQLRIASKQFSENVQSALAREVYFTVNDNFAYRMETTEGERNERKAICCFNDPTISSQLISVFDKNFASCMSYPLPRLAYTLMNQL